MTDNAYDFEEEEQLENESSSNDNYETHKIPREKGTLLSFILELASDEEILFPYSYLIPTKLTKIETDYYTLTLMGGGLNLILHLRNHDKKARRDFLNALATHRITRIFEYSGNSSKVDFPIISKIEEF